MQSMLYILDPDNFLSEDFGVENSAALKNQDLHDVGDYCTQGCRLQARNRVIGVGGAA